VKAQIDAIGAAPMEGSISRVAFALDPTTRTMLAEADLKNADLKLHPGMYAMTKIAVEKHENVMLIPLDGLVMEKTNAFVFTLVDGKAKKNAVVIGFNDGAQVEIVSGLDRNATVLLPGKITLLPEQAVTAKP
jgi:multidrug efflux pump subunit AcrA (membrane-fusion protein)